MTVAEVIYDAGHRFAPDPGSAIDVLTFLLMPVEVYVPTRDPAELDAVGSMLAPAKAEAMRRWLAINRGPS